MPSTKTSTNTRRSKIDWEGIEREWRVGKLTQREIADRYGVSDEGMRKRFKRLGITRDLTDNIKNPVAVAGCMESLDRSGFIYVIYMDDTSNERFYKVGMSASFSERFGSHQCSSPFQMFVACAYFVGNMRAEERELHDEFADKRVRGEWFRLNDGDLDFIASRARLV